MELAFAAAAAAAVAGLGVELRLFAPRRAPRRGEAIVWSTGWLLLAVAVGLRHLGSYERAELRRALSPTGEENE